MHDDGVAGQILLSIRSEIAVFALEFLDSIGVVDTLVTAQVVFVGKFSSACRTRMGPLVDGQVDGKMVGEGSFANGNMGAEVARIGARNVV
jgi:hypothetical protein